MSVDLSPLRLSAATPSLIDFGGVITPPLGGPAQRIERLGSRWSWEFTTPPVRVEAEGRQWAALLTRAAREGAILPVPQPDLVPGNPGAPVVASLTAAGTLVPVSGLAAGYAIGAGRWVSVIVGGTRYLDLIVEDVTASGAGTATLRLANLIRVPFPAGAVVELAAPKVEGWLAGPPSWPLDSARLTGFTFAVQEAA